MITHQRQCVLFLIGFVWYALLSCAVTGSPKPTLYESQPEIFSRLYSTAEIEAIETGFKVDPSQYTQDFANMILWRIHIKNRDFSRQVAKLPDLNDGITPKEARALSAIYDYIHDIPFMKGSGMDHPASAQLTLITEMISDGRTNDRYRYSPSLEAFWWLVLDNTFNPPLFASQYHDSLALTTNVWGTMSGPRWTDYDRVLNRLNMPDLIHYFINKKIRFRRGPIRGAARMFKTNEGQAVDAAYFTEQALKRAGYQTFIRSIRWRDDHGTGEHTGAGIILSDGGYLLVADFTGQNRMSGPYSTVSDMDHALSGGKNITGRTWGVFDPSP